MYGLIAVRNQSTVVGPELKEWTAAIAHQLRYHVAPGWHIAVPPVVFYSNPADVPKGAWQLVVLDDADQAGALGYHDNQPDGTPYAKVFAKTCIDNGVSVSSCLSHEAIEAAVDPTCRSWVQMGDGDAYALEACDPVEGDSYQIGGVEVSDFVLPGWFDDNPRDVTPTHYLGTHGPKTHLESLAMTLGGYFIWAPDGDLTRATAKYGNRRPEYRAALKGAGSRTWRRLPA